MEALDRIEAERACERLVMRYALAVNSWDIEAFVGLFTPDAIWQRPANPPLVGHAAIQAFMEGQPAGRTLRHVNGLCLVTVADSGDRATASSQTTVYDTAARAGLPVPLAGPDMVVEYEDVIVRTAAGWRFARRDTTVVFSARA